MMSNRRMKTAVMILMLLALQEGRVFAAKRVDVRKRMTSMMDHFNSPTGKRSLNGAKASANQMLGLQSGEDLQKATKMKTVSGSIKTKYQETYKGVPVAGEGVVLETDTNGQWTGDASGQLVEGLEKDVPSVTPSLSKNQALQVALAAAGIDSNDIDFDENTDAKIKVFVQDEGSDNVDVSANLAYVLSFRTETNEGMARPYYVIDAFTGDVLSTWEGIANFPIFEDFSNKETTNEGEASATQGATSTNNNNRDGELVFITGDGGNVGTGRHIYGKDYGKLLVTKIGDRCYLNNDQVEVQEFTLCNYTKNRQDTNATHRFSCYEGNHDFVNGAYSPSNDAYYYSLACYNMYKNWYDTTPLDFKIKVRVHFANYPNAFWDGKRVTFLDGGYRMFPLTEPGIVGHELSHGFTEHNSGLIYNSQSGGINEAFSDMAGEALEYFLDNKTDFLVGGRVAKHNGKPLRYMADPTMDGRSLSSFDDYCDGINVHYSSGIFNRAFYLLVNEKGWPIREAFHVFVVANQIHWRESSGFHDAACGVKIAAKDLGYKEDDIFQVFRKVGVIPCMSGPTTEIRGIGSLKVEGKGAQNFVWRAAAGTKDAKIALTGGSGDANMIVKYGSRVTVSQRKQLAGKNGGDQVVSFPNPKPGNYYITIFTDTGFEDARVDVAYDYSNIMKEITESDLLNSETRVFFYGGRNHTWMRRVYGLDSIALNDFLQVEAKPIGRVYMMVIAGQYTDHVDYYNVVGHGINKVRVCKLTKKQYYVVVTEEVKDIDESDECELCGDEKKKVSSISAFSGTKIKRDYTYVC